MVQSVCDSDARYSSSKNQRLDRYEGLTSRTGRHQPGSYVSRIGCARSAFDDVTHPDVVSMASPGCVERVGQTAPQAL